MSSSWQGGGLEYLGSQALGREVVGVVVLTSEVFLITFFPSHLPQTSS